MGVVFALLSVLCVIFDHGHQSPFFFSFSEVFVASFCCKFLSKLLNKMSKMAHHRNAGADVEAGQNYSCSDSDFDEDAETQTFFGRQKKRMTRNKGVTVAVALFIIIR